MPRRDPLVALQRLRALERDQARIAFAAAEAAREVATLRLARSARAFDEEAAAAPAAYAAWLPAAQAAQALAEQHLNIADAKAEAARSTLATADAEAKALATLLRTRRAAARRLQRAAEQWALDEVAGRGCAPSGPTPPTGSGPLGPMSSGGA